MRSGRKPSRVRPSRRRSAPAAGRARSLANWRTDEELHIVAIHSVKARLPGHLLAVGEVIPRSRRGTTLLDRKAHLEALRGRSSVHRWTLHQQAYEVDVSPLYGRRHRIIGTRGILKLLPGGQGVKGGGEADTAHLPLSLASAVRSLELARTVAQTVKIAAESKTRKAQELQLLTEQALLRKEADERRARLLADASSILDSTTSLPTALDRLGGLLVQRLADWWVLQLRDDGGLRRAALGCRDARLRELLEHAYLPYESAEPADFLFLSRPIVYPQAGQADLADLVTKNRQIDQLLQAGVSSFLRVPVRLHGRILGALTLGMSDPEAGFELADARMAEDLAYRIALAQESIRLYEEAQREITRRREAEARLRKFNADLERRVSDRTMLLEEANREANSFAYTVAHDLRAPLRAITGFSQVLKEEYAGVMDAMGKDYLDRIVGSAQRMDELIRDLLEYARLNRTEITLGIVDLDDLLGRTMQILAQESQERGARIRWDPPLGKVIGQEVILSQALRNLLSNAIKFVAPGVTPEVRITTEPRDHRLRIVIQDNGIGIAPEHHSRIFGMFERLNSADQYPGTGMGLAIVRRAVERLGGEVGVESQAGQGARFWIDLPATGPEVPTAPPS
jgi:signal transduction histidine kinase